jgi:hypothetical protein
VWLELDVQVDLVPVASAQDANATVEAPTTRASAAAGACSQGARSHHSSPQGWSLLLLPSASARFAREKQRKP